MGLYSDTRFFFFFFTFRNGFSYQITASQLWVTTVHEQSMISSLIPLGHFVLVSNIWSFDLLGVFNSNLWHRKNQHSERLFMSFFWGQHLYCEWDSRMTQFSSPLTLPFKLFSCLITSSEVWAMDSWIINLQSRSFFMCFCSKLVNGTIKWHHNHLHLRLIHTWW